MTTNDCNSTLDRFCLEVIDKLKAVDIDQLVQFYSVPPIDEEDRTHKLRGLLPLDDALDALEFAKSLIK